MRAGLRPLRSRRSVPTNCDNLRLMSRSGASIREASLPAGGEGSKPLFNIGAAKRILKQLIAVLGTCENMFYARDAGPRVRRNDLRQRQGLDVRVVNELLDEADLPCGFAQIGTAHV